MAASASWSCVKPRRRRASTSLVEEKLILLPLVFRLVMATPAVASTEVRAILVAGSRSNPIAILIWPRLSARSWGEQMMTPVDHTGAVERGKPVVTGLVGKHQVELGQALKQFFTHLQIYIAEHTAFGLEAWAQCLSEFRGGDASARALCTIRSAASWSS